MKQHSSEEIRAEVQRLFDEKHAKSYIMGWASGGCIEIVKNTPDRVDIKIECMYEAPSPSYDILKQLAEFFVTENINDDNAFGYSGCETCDYGSRYGYTLTVRA